LPELDAAIGAFIVSDYNARRHGEIGVPPRTCWIAEGWLPRMPDRLEDLDELLGMVAQSRTEDVIEAARSTLVIGAT